MIWRLGSRSSIVVRVYKRTKEAIVMEHLSMVAKDANWRSRVYKEKQAAKYWKPKWGWVKDDLLQLETDLHECARNSKFLPAIYPESYEMGDPRDIRPIPSVTNHWYGWISSKPEFSLICYDRVRLPPLPSLYKIPKHTLKPL